VKVHQAADQGESDPHAAPRPVDRRVGLREELEDVGERLGCNADAGIGDPDRDIAAASMHRHLDPPPRRRVLQRVPQQIGEDLLQPDRITEHPKRTGIGGHRQVEPVSSRRRLQLGDQPLQERDELDRLTLEDHLAGGHPGHIEQVVHQSGEHVDLALDEPELPGGVVVALAPCSGPGRERDRVPDRPERVAQLVPEHREESVALPDRELQIGQELAGGVLPRPRAEPRLHRVHHRERMHRPLERGDVPAEGGQGVQHPPVLGDGRAGGREDKDGNVAPRWLCGDGRTQPGESGSIERLGGNDRGSGIRQAVRQLGDVRADACHRQAPERRGGQLGVAARRCPDEDVLRSGSGRPGRLSRHPYLRRGRPASLR